MPLSAYLQDRLLEKAFRNRNFTIGAIWVSLHTGDPGTDGSVEFVGGGYKRQVATFRPAESGRMSSGDILDWPNMPTGDVVGFGLWDSVEGGNYLGGSLFMDVRSVQMGDTYRIPQGNVDIAIS